MDPLRFRFAFGHLLELRWFLDLHEMMYNTVRGSSQKCLDTHR